IHGNKSQSARTRALSGFKDGKIAVLVATDIAARGLDIDQLPQVVNFELPNVPEDYVHRIGRTGRAGSPGSALPLVDNSEIKLLKDIERVIKRPIDRIQIAGWDPSTIVRTASSGSAGDDERRDSRPRGRREGGGGGGSGRPARAGGRSSAPARHGSVQGSGQA